MTVRRGRTFLQTPGPTNIPERVLAAMMRGAVEMAGPEYSNLTLSCFEDLKKIFRTDGTVIGYAANGHGAWEAALVNVLSPGDKILVPETGNFSRGWRQMADALGLETDVIATDWRHAVRPGEVGERLAADRGHEIKAVLMVHTDTATAIDSDVAQIRKAIDEAGHPALYLVDTIAALSMVDFRMDDWGIDVAVGASQKGLMTPPGLSFLAINDKAREAAERSTTPRNYWDWRIRDADEYYRWFCGTPPVNLILGLREALNMIFEEGLQTIFDRHARLATAVRVTVEHWGQAGDVEINAKLAAERSNSVTTIRLPDGIDGEMVRQATRERFDVATASGLGDLAGCSFRIGHMGDVNEPMLLGTLICVEKVLGELGVKLAPGGPIAALDGL